MSKHSQPSFRYHGWTVTDANRGKFIAESSLDTFVENQLHRLDEAAINGKPYEAIIASIFARFEWFVTNNAVVKNCGGNHAFNYIFLSEILEHKLETDYYISCCVRYDGTITYI